MKLGKVIGSVWATKKAEGLNGFKLMIIEPLGKPDELSGDLNCPDNIIAADTIGAGIGDTVIYSEGKAARLLTGSESAAPIDAAIVGIVDR